jgi:hypothetical protein
MVIGENLEASILWTKEKKEETWYVRLRVWAIARRDVEFVLNGIHYIRVRKKKKEKKKRREERKRERKRGERR